MNPLYRAQSLSARVEMFVTGRDIQDVAETASALAVMNGVRFGLFGPDGRCIDVFYPTISCHFNPAFVGNLAIDARLN